MSVLGFPELIERAKAALSVRELSEDCWAGSVASALLTEAGNVYVGVCIDVSCGIGFCAEHAAIAAMVTAGEHRIEKIVAVCGKGVLPPCGRCREFISQVHGGNMDTQVMVAEGKAVALRELLPFDWRASFPPPVSEPKSGSKEPSAAQAPLAKAAGSPMPAGSVKVRMESPLQKLLESPAGSLLERMEEFFAARVEGYDSHMLEEVPGCREGYEKMAELLPAGIDTLLDLGCGTGLELDAIFQSHPSVRVTGIDLTQSMLDKLLEKHGDKQLQLINASYFDHAFGKTKFDAAVSFESLHHFSPEAKASLYAKIYAALKAHGCYIECDYMVLDQAEADRLAAENRALRARDGIAEDEYYHFDTPCTVDTQIRLLQAAGFQSVEMVWRHENTTMIVARKMNLAT